LHRRSGEIIDKASEEAGKHVVPAGEFSLYTTGHSLGGGLAQNLAYSDTRIKDAIVFDPSPVTGYSTVVKDSEVNCNVRVLRIYERGEALQYVRATIRLFYTLSRNIQEVAFNLIHSGGNPILNHSRSQFDEGLKNIAGSPGLISDLPAEPDCDCFRVRRNETPAMCQSTHSGQD
jgi:hypothetical protein